MVLWPWYRLQGTGHALAELTPLRALPLRIKDPQRLQQLPPQRIVGAGGGAGGDGGDGDGLTAQDALRLHPSLRRFLRSRPRP